MKTRRHFQTTDQAARRRIPTWIEEILEGLTAAELIRALAYWRAQTAARSDGLQGPCSWCAKRAPGRLCLGCQKRDDAGWRKSVKVAGTEVLPPLENLSDRLQRIEEALFMDDGVKRVEEGPFAPESILAMLRAGAAGERDDSPEGSCLNPCEAEGNR